MACAHWCPPVGILPSGPSLPSDPNLSSVFLVALDQSIVSTALPKLSSEFQALEQLTWIVSTYFLTQAGLMLFFGQVLSRFDLKCNRTRNLHVE